MTCHDRLGYSLLTPNDNDVFEELFKIYTKTMPARERKPKTELRSLLGNSDYRVVVLSVGDKTIGYSVVFVPKHNRFCLLEYMGIDAPWRSKGFGRELFNISYNVSVLSLSKKTVMLLEVESDLENSIDIEVRRKRLNFYYALGCMRVEGLNYILPLAGKGKPPEIFILIYSARGPTIISKSSFRGWLAEIFERVYNCSPRDPRILKMVRNLQDPIVLCRS